MQPPTVDHNADAALGGGKIKLFPFSINAMDASQLSKKELRSFLDNIQTVGEFYTFRRYPTFANPGLQIDGTDTIPLPLTPRDAETIKNACVQSPFGKGDQTLVDTSVRKSWELTHTQFHLMNPEWDAFFQTVLKAATDGLGLSDVSAQPHKLLLYEEGSFFKRHKDSEKEQGMVGTLVVCLPSRHTGGEVRLSFGGRECELATGPASAFDLTALAWFSDVTHEVEKVTSGYRLALTYNLIQNGSAKPPSAHFFSEQSHTLQQLLVKWQAKDPHAKLLLYPLEHQYTQSSISLKNLKGRDAAVCQGLLDVCSTAGLFLFFAHMTHSTLDDYYDEDESEDDTYLDKVYTVDGKQIASKHEVELGDILGESVFEGRDPDSEEEGEFTGNEGAPNTYRYHDTVCLSPPALLCFRP